MSPDIEPEQLDVERVALSPEILVGAAWNPNEMTEDEFVLLKEQITEVGFIKTPIVAKVEGIDGHTFYEIVAGHHRVQAAIDLGLNKIPVDVLQGDKWQEEDLRKLQNVRMNVLHGSMNPEKMVTLYNEMATKYGEKATKMLGYATDAGIQKLIKQVSGDIKKSMSAELSEQFEDQAKEARTVGDLDKIIQRFMSEGGDTAKYGFVVFTWGGKEHVYVAMSDKTREAMKRIVRASRSKKVDINEVIEEAISDAARGLEFYDD
jgi:hypothetical protein